MSTNRIQRLKRKGREWISEVKQTISHSRSPRPLQTSLRPDTTSRSQNHVLSVVKDIATGLRKVLAVTGELSDPLHSLQGVVSGILAILEVYDTHFLNKETTIKLKRYIESLNQVITAVASHDPKDLPDLKVVLDRFNKDISEVAEGVDKLEKKSNVGQAIRADKISEELEGYVQSITWHVSDLKVSLDLCMYLAVTDFKAIISKGQYVVPARSSEIHKGDAVVEAHLDSIHDKLTVSKSDLASGLHYAAQASFEADSERAECAPSTREGVLRPIFEWAGLEHSGPSLPSTQQSVIPSSSPILWINGVAGTGKSTLAQSISRRLNEDNRLGASFFCSRFGDRSDVKLIFPTIALQLALLSKEFWEALISAVRSTLDVHLHRPADQLRRLIVEPLKSAAAAGAPIQDKAIVIDALDECRDSEPVSVILSALSQHVESLENLRIIVTSRPEDHINQGFLQDVLKNKTHSFHLSDVPQEVVHADIKAYVKYKLKDFASRNPLLYGSPDWPGDEIIERICALSKGLFIYAATSVKYVTGGQLDEHERRLSHLLSPELERTYSEADDTNLPFVHLDRLYLHVLRTAFGHSVSASRVTAVKIVIGSIVALQDRLSPVSLDLLLHLRTGMTRRVCQRLGSVFVIPEDEQGVIDIIHPSFIDFIISARRCAVSQFTISPSLQHSILAICCFETMNGMLRKDISDLGRITLNSDVSDLDSDLSDKVPQHLLYACRNWMEHTRLAQISSDIVSSLEQFCRIHMLQWLEVLSFHGDADLRICDGLKGVQHTLQETPVPSTSMILALLRDCEGMVRASYPVIRVSTTHIYKSALAFCPSGSKLREVYAHELQYSMVQVSRGLQTTWSADGTTLEGHSNTVWSVAYSPSGDWIISASSDKTIRLWDSQTGSLLCTFQDENGVLSAAFSPDERTIISGSDQGVLRLWDACTGICIASRMAHSGWVRAVVYSPDGCHVASGSHDTAVKLWAVASGNIELVREFDGHTNWVRCVAFSLDGSSLLSVSDDCTCRLWTISGDAEAHILRQDDRVRAVAIAYDEQTIVCGCGNGKIVLWNEDGPGEWKSRNPIKLKGNVQGLAICSDGYTFAIGCGSSIYLYDLTTESSIRDPLVTSGKVGSLSFSPDGLHLVAAVGNNVHIWDYSQTSTYEGTTRPSDAYDASKISLLSLSPRGHLLATFSEADRAVVFWDTHTGDQHHKTSVVESAPSVFYISWTADGYQLALWGDSGEYSGNAYSMCLWDVLQEEWIGSPVIDNHGDVDDRRSGQFHGYALDAHHVVSLLNSRLCLWDAGAGSCSQLPGVEGMRIRDMAVSGPEACLVTSSAVSGSQKYTILIHCLNSGELLQTVDAPTSYMGRISVSHDGTRLIACCAYPAEFYLLDLTPLVDPACSPADQSSGIVSCQWTHLGALGIASSGQLVGFSADGRGVLTTTGFAPLKAREHWPLSAKHPQQLQTEVATQLTENYYLSDGWVWHVCPSVGPHRVCWLPPVYRDIDAWNDDHNQYGAKHLPRGDMTVGHQVIAFKTKETGIVILDMSRCHDESLTSEAAINASQA